MGKKPVLQVSTTVTHLTDAIASEGLYRTLSAKLRHSLDLWFQLYSSGSCSTFIRPLGKCVLPPRSLLFRREF
ncbi:hypothetical protein AFLA70_269g001841 [Aspergillus flavus AF70]|nr:hypothetical protein AFLA70_269g001841 [Aspergillus flavus AF70]